MTIAETDWKYESDGSVVLTFKDFIHNTTYVKAYKTVRAAKIAETKFHDKVARSA